METSKDGNTTTTISPIEGIHFTFVHANGIRHRLASTNRHDNLLQRRQQESTHIPSSRGKRSLILFLHGFPESWYSWRHQLLFLKPFHQEFVAVAPDMRGYGSTDQPYSVDSYRQDVLAKDVVEIASALGYEQFLLVGHDWGCQLAWSVSLLYPSKVLGVCGMSIPYSGTPKVSLLDWLQAKYGKSLGGSLTPNEIKEAKFHYMLHHCLEGCADEYNKNASELLYRLYANQKITSNNAQVEMEPGTPEYDLHGYMFPFHRENQSKLSNERVDASMSPGLWKRLPRPKSLPSWLSRKDLQYLTKEFQRVGFHGPICWYRAMALPPIQPASGDDDKIRIPTLFLMGGEDSMIMNLYGGPEKVCARLQEHIPGLIQPPLILPNCGHWIQQERASFVNPLLVKFFRQVVVMRTSKL